VDKQIELVKNTEFGNPNFPHINKSMGTRHKMWMRVPNWSSFKFLCVCSLFVASFRIDWGIDKVMFWYEIWNWQSIPSILQSILSIFINFTINSINSINGIIDKIGFQFIFSVLPRISKVPNIKHFSCYQRIRQTIVFATGPNIKKDTSVENRESSNCRQSVRYFYTNI